MPIRKAVILAGGWGTRFFPFTKIVPKEMLPVAGIPAIHHIVQECLTADFEEIIIVTRPGDDLVARYFQEAVSFAPYLLAKGQEAQLRLGDFSHWVERLTFVSEQHSDVYGSGVPLMQLRERLASEVAFAVLFADDLVLGDVPAIGEVVAAWQQHEATTAVAMQRMPASELAYFGNVALGERLTLQTPERFLINDLVQRPSLTEVVSPYAVVSRLILTPAIFDELQRPHSNGELDLGLAMAAQAKQQARVVGVELSGQWVTVGDPHHYLLAQQVAADYDAC